MEQNFWRGRNIFVTGCTGLLGSWLTEALVQAGASVVGLIRDIVPQSQLYRSGTIRQIKTVRGELCDYDLLERTIAEYEIEYVYHLAAQTIVGTANRAPMSTFETNIRGTYMLLEAARRNATICGVVVAGSDKAYGDQPDLPYTEEAPLMGKHPYDVSKSCADLIAQAYAHSYQLPAVVIRCANLYGGGDLNWNRILPGTIHSVLHGERPVIRSDGSFKRDYLYVKDAVQGYLTAVSCFADQSQFGEAFNLGIGRPVEALELVKTIIEMSEYPALEPVILNKAENEIQDQYLCSDKAQRVLGWEPQFTLESGLAETMAWYREFLQII